jgi:hypothetical protein
MSLQIPSTNFSHKKTKEQLKHQKGNKKRIAETLTTAGCTKIATTP